VNEKPWYLSKTLWVNALTLAGSLLAVAAGSEMIAAHPQAAAAVAAGIAIGEHRPEIPDRSAY